MNSTPRRSNLQLRILAHLASHSVDSIAAMARNLESSRPAVSRSLATLKVQGCVEKIGRTWSLTDLGEGAAAAAIDKLQESTVRFVELAGQQFRVLNDTGMDEPLALSASALTDISALAHSSMQEFVNQSGATAALRDFSVAVSGWDASESLASAASFQDQLASLGGFSSASTLAGMFDYSAVDVIGASSRESAAFDLTKLAQASFSAASGAERALADALVGTTGLVSAFDPAELYRDLGLSLADTMAESFALTTQVSADVAAFRTSLEAITGNVEPWPAAYRKAASELLDLGVAASRLHETFGQTTIGAAGDILSGLANANLPEPLQFDAMRVFGLNTERIHTPAFWLPPVEPITTIREAEFRAIKVRRERDQEIADTVYALEHTLRDMISTVLRRRYGEEWWERGVPARIRGSCRRLKERREVRGSLRYDLIEYTSLGELKEIILREANWGDDFADVFRDRVFVEAMFLFTEPVRNDDYHSRLSSNTEVKEFLFAANWLIDAAESALAAP